MRPMGPRWLVPVLLIVVLVGGAATVAAVIVFGRDDSGKPVTLGIKDNDAWRASGPASSSRTDARPALSASAGQARQRGLTAQADQLQFYADSAAAVGDVRLAAVTTDDRSLMVVRSHDDRSESLKDSLTQQASEAASQGGHLEVAPVQFRGQDAYRVTVPTGREGLINQEYWLDLHEQRLSVELTGTIGGVQQLFTALELS